MNKLYACLFFVCLFLVQIQSVMAQTGPAKQWDKTLGGSLNDNCHSLLQTPDGGFLLGGYSGSGVSGDKSQPNLGGQFSFDFWLVKVDAFGNKIWDRTIGGSGLDRIRVVQPTADGNYILGGYSTSPIGNDKSEHAKGGSGDFWLVKVDPNGVKIWDKTLGGDGTEDIYALQQTPDGGFILGGYSTSNISGDKSQSHRGFADYWVIKVDAFGNKVWDRTLGGDGTEYLSSVIQTADGGYLVGGYSSSGNSFDKTQASKGDFDYWVIKLNAAGVKMWDKSIGGAGSDELFAMHQTADGNYLLAGWSDSGISGNKSQPSKGFSDFWLVKIDGTGNVLWDKTLGGLYGDEITSIDATADGGFILGGTSNSSVSGDKTQPSLGQDDYWVVKVDALGNKIWDKTFGGNSQDELNSIKQTADGGYIIGGQSPSGISTDKTQASKGSYDFWIIKLGPNCAELDATLTVNCGQNPTGANVNIAGFLPMINAAPAWTLVYTLDGVTQTLQGSSATVQLAPQFPVGTNITLVSITSGSCSKNLSQSLTILPVPAAPTVTAAGRCSPGSLTLNAAGAPTGGNYLWYNAATGGTALQSGLLGTFNTPTLTASATYYVAVANNSGCESPRVAVSATITDITVAAGSNQTICESAAPMQLSGFSPAGGTWSGAGVSPTGLFTPANPLIGNQTLTYTLTQNGCTFSATKVITVTAAPVVSAGVPDTVCANAQPLQLAGFSPSGGTWSGQGISAGGLFTPSVSLTGTQILTYAVTQNGCTITATKEVVVKPIPTLVTGPAQIICESAAPLQLTGFSPAGGSWTGPGVSAAGLFTPAGSLIGNKTLTYTVIQNGCSVSANLAITVTAAPVVNAGSNDTLCADAAPVQLTGFSPAGGTWTGAGVSSSGLFTPNASLAGTQTLTYAFTQNGCTISATKQVNIPAPLSQPVITLHSPDTLIASVLGATYEWKLNNSVIPGNSRKLKVTTAGTYALRVLDKFNCSSLFSPDFNYTISGLKDDLLTNLKLYPNPTSGILTVELPTALPVEITVQNTLGQSISYKTLGKTAKKATLDLQHLPKGMYLVSLKTEKQVVIKKVVLD